MIFSFKDSKKGETLIIEALNILTDSTLAPIPILVLFDSSNKDMEKLNETFKNKINTLDKKLINTQYINFENRVGDLKFGFQWLADVMQPI